MIDLYGKSHVYVQFGQAPGPFSTQRAELKATAKGDPGDCIWRVKVPGYGWRKLRYPELRERLAGQVLSYVILTGDERASIVGDLQNVKRMEGSDSK